jgi:hypothetical protein
MTRQKYNFRESANRILRTLQGQTPPVDYPETLTGDVLTTDEAMSDLAELLAGSLPNSVFTAPNSEIAWGQLYFHTGTVSTMTGLTANAYALITGAFQSNYCDDSGVLVNPTNAAQLLITKNGSYFVTWNLDIVGSSAIKYTAAPHLNSGTVQQAVGVVTPAASGSVIGLAGSCFLYVSGSAVPFDLRINPSATAWAKFVAGQLTIHRIGKYK